MIAQTVLSTIVSIAVLATLRAEETQTEHVSGAAKAFSITQARDSQYALDRLRSGKSDLVGFALNQFEAQYPKLSTEDRFLLAMLILANYSFEGEYSFRFGMMVKDDKKVIAKKIKLLKPENVALFLETFPSASFAEFGDRCQFYFDVRPSGK